MVRPAGLRIGPFEIWPPVVLAPMAGVTNAPFRRLCRRFGAGLYVSEMVMATALVHGNAKTERMVAFDADEWPRSMQLYGSDPTVVGEAVRRLVGDDRVDHVDLNFGCPARKVTRRGGGAAVPLKPRLLAEIVRAAVRAAEAAGIPVTVKCRKGVSDELLTFLSTGRAAEDEGAAAIALHARTAEQHYAGEADWSAIAELKCSVSIPVLGNGDLWEAPDALRMMAETGCDGVVVGRGCLGRPWLFGDLAANFAGEPLPPPRPLGEVAAVLREHAELLVAHLGPARGVVDLRKHTSWYLTGYPVGPEVRRRFAQVSTLGELDDLVAGLDPELAPVPGAGRLKRGHTNGPITVALPDGYLAELDDVRPPDESDVLVLSGG
jgi:nifR3 family TIM-barrel protein